MRETVDVARSLLGKFVVRRSQMGAVLEGRVVEVEAYRGTDDPASHAYRGMTNRSRIMFQQVGVAYIYFIYGNHHCLNVTARARSEQAGAVLIRALEPRIGIEYMIRNRGLRKERSATGKGTGALAQRELTNGPGKLTQAMQISGDLNGTDMTDPRSELFIKEDSGCRQDLEIVTTRRIGISDGGDKLWRFYIRDNEFVSRKKSEDLR